MPKPIYKTDLTLYPFVVICGCTRQAGVEKLTWTARDIDRDGKLFVSCPLYKLTTNLPGRGLVEGLELRSCL